MYVSSSIAIFTSLYILLLWLLLYGIKKKTVQNIKVKSDFPFVSVVVAIRNEEKYIENLLYDLKNQKYPASKFEIILVNDHSTDKTEPIIQSFIKINNAFSLIQLTDEKQGKKEALYEGFTVAQGELILTTDADCRVPDTWLDEMAHFYNSFYPALIIGPVRIQQDASFFSKIQALEFSGLVATAAGSANLGYPILCNGANLGYSRKALLEVLPGLYSPTPSGDDIFLLQSMRKSGYLIAFNPSYGSIITTLPQAGFKNFIWQRIRWASKSKKFSDKLTLGVSLIVFFSHLAFVVSLSLLFSKFDNKEILILCIFLKFITDYIFLASVKKNLAPPMNLKYFIPASFFISFYTLFIGFIGIHLSYSWKNRKLR